MKTFMYAEDARKAGFTKTIKWLEDKRAVLVYNQYTKEYALVI